MDVRIERRFIEKEEGEESEFGRSGAANGCPVPGQIP
jgi:hypothetical protein